jgi:hypothetical protein
MFLFAWRQELPPSSPAFLAAFRRQRQATVIHRLWLPIVRRFGVDKFAGTGRRSLRARRKLIVVCGLPALVVEMPAKN